MLQHLIIHFSLHYLSGGYGRWKTKKKFKRLAPKVIAVAYERWSLTRGSKYSDLTLTFGILENWSLRRGGRLRVVVATGGSTVFYITVPIFTISQSEAMTTDILQCQRPNLGAVNTLSYPFGTVRGHMTRVWSRRPWVFWRDVYRRTTARPNSPDISSEPNLFSWLTSLSSYICLGLFSFQLCEVVSPAR